MTRVSIYGVPITYQSRAKITDDEVREIRKSTLSDAEIAKKYKISKTHAHAVKRRKIRRNVE